MELLTYLLCIEHSPTLANVRQFRLFLERRKKNGFEGFPHPDIPLSWWLYHAESVIQGKGNRPLFAQYANIDVDCLLEDLTKQKNKKVLDSLSDRE